MNKWLYFIGGLAIGAVAGVFGYRQYLIYTYEDPEEDYSDYERVDDEEEEINPMSDEEEDEIKEKLEKNYKETTNYAAMYQGDAANHEHPVDSDEEEEENNEGFLTEDEQDALDETLEHQKNKDKKPKIISLEAVADLPGYVDMQTLLYYTKSDTLVTEEDEEIVDRETFIGDALTKYGFNENDEERIWVRNYAMDICYEIQKVNAEWE